MKIYGGLGPKRKDPANVWKSKGKNFRPTFIKRNLALLNTFLCQFQNTFFYDQAINIITMCKFFGIL